MIRALVISLRPHQWPKNLFVLAGPVFAKRILEPAVLLRSLAVLGLFTVVASGVYLLNDIADRGRDREHPRKRRRPVAAGDLSVRVAAVAAAILLVAGMGLGFLVSAEFGGLLALYVGIQAAYSIWLRGAVLIDVFCIASGFVIRVLGGAVAVEVYVSSWLILTTIFLSLFLALCKRRAEASVLGEDQGTGHRETLQEYSLRFLDQLISVTTASVVLCYSLYTLDPRTEREFGTRSLIFTVPFVIYGIFRYLFVVYRRDGGGSPVSSVATDAPLAVNTLLWAASIGAIIYL